MSRSIYKLEPTGKHYCFRHSAIVIPILPKRSSFGLRHTGVSPRLTFAMTEVEHAGGVSDHCRFSAICIE
jgi:hypothetical protein